MAIENTTINYLIDLNSTGLGEIMLKYLIELLIGGGGIVALVTYLSKKISNAESIKKEYFEIYKNSNNITPDDFNLSKFVDYYHSTKEYDEINEAINYGKNVLLIGKPNSGKTRTFFEILKRKRGFNIIKFWPESFIHLEKIPNFILKNKLLLKSNNILFFDDLNKYVNKINMYHLIKKFTPISKNLIIVSTCRTGKEYKLIKDEFSDILGDFIEIKLEEVDKNFAEEINEKYNLNFDDFDGTVGSLFLGLDDMKTRYDNFEEEYHILFRIIKLFHVSQNYFVDRGLLKAFYLNECKNITTNKSFETLVEILKENSFINEKNNNISLAHDSYFDIEEYFPNPKDWLELQTFLMDKKEYEYLFNLGNLFREINLYTNALICYEEILSFDEKNYKVINNAGVVLTDMGLFDDALIYFDKNIKLNPEAEKGYHGKGMALYEKGEMEKAVTYFDKAIEINPNYYSAFTNKSGALAKLGKFEEAKHCLNEAIKIDSKNIVAFYNKGMLLYENKKYNKALDCLNKGLLADNKDLDSLMLKGIILSALNRHDESVNTLQASLEVEGNDFKTLFDKGTILMELDRDKEALDYFNKATLKVRNNHDMKKLLSRQSIAFINLKMEEKSLECLENLLKIEPNNIDSLLSKGVVLFKQKRFKKSIEVFDKILEHDSNNFSAQYNKSTALYELKEWDNALTSFNNALKINSSSKYEKKIYGFIENIYFNKGLINMNNKEYQEAIDNFHNVLKINPENSETLELNAQTQFFNGELEESLSCIEKYFKINKQLNEKLLALKGIVLSEKRNFDDAIMIFDEYLNSYPKEIFVLKNKAYCLRQLKKQKECLKIYDKILKIDKYNESALYWKGVALMMLKRFDEALNIFNKFLKINSTCDKAFFNKGSVLYCLGKKDKALLCVKEALRINPEYDLALKFLEDIEQI